MNSTIAKMKKILWKNKEILIVLLLAVFVSLATSGVYFNELIRLPKDHVFIGVTHYWEDFFYYLDQFYQGAHGSWLTLNNFTSENFPAVPFYFSHILLGKLGGTLGLQPFESYNLSAFLLKYIFICLSYILIVYLIPTGIRKRIYAFLIFLFFTSFPRMILEGNKITLGTYELYRGENTVFSRFGLIPNSYLSNILTILFFLFFYKLIVNFLKKHNTNIFKPSGLITLFLGLGTAGLLAVTDFAKGLVVLPSVFYILTVSFFKEKIKFRFSIEIFTMFVIILFYLFMGLWLKTIVSVNLAYDNSIKWDLEQNKNVLLYLIQNPSYLIMAFGISGILALIGMFRFVKKEKTIIEKMFSVSLMVALAGYFIPYWKIIPIPGFRLLFPAVYVFYSVIVLNGIIVVGEFINTKFRVPVQKAIFILMLVYILINSVTFIPSFLQQFKPITLSNYVFSYMPNDLYTGLLALENLEPKNAIVVSNPNTEVDSLIPGITGKRGFTGHILMTIDEPYKRTLITKLFSRNQPSEVAINLLKKYQIKYIFFTNYDGDANGFAQYYTFLKIVFQNSFVTIFAVPS